ncbi:hypothetical protein V6N12_058479 [Hibiscus sabdariffa]|uniref:Uncharacterized protein n=1 Tax=Hibiscus sabdariffa TaxID=183260 RepID=A0ABR2ES88_9ROSI
MASILKQLSSLLFIFKVYCHNNASLARSPFKDQESSLLKRPHHNARSFWTPMTDVAKYYPDCCDLQFCWKRLDNCVRNEVLSGFKEQRPWQQMKLIKNRVLNESNWMGMRPETTKRGSSFDIEDLEETEEIGSS